MTQFPLSMLRRSLGTAAMASVLAVAFAMPALAATPRDTLVVAFAFDDIITMDPAEAFEISAGEIMGNTYDRLVRFDVNDPSGATVTRRLARRPVAGPDVAPTPRTMPCHSPANPARSPACSVLAAGKGGGVLAHPAATITIAASIRLPAHTKLFRIPVSFLGDWSPRSPVSRVST